MMITIICHIAIFHSKRQIKITCVCLSVCMYNCSFYSILIKFCTAVQCQKSKIDFGWDEHLPGLQIFCPNCYHSETR